MYLIPSIAVLRGYEGAMTSPGGASRIKMYLYASRSLLNLLILPPLPSARPHPPTRRLAIYWLPIFQGSPAHCEVGTPNSISLEKAAEKL